MITFDTYVKIFARTEKAAQHFVIINHPQKINSSL